MEAQSLVSHQHSWWFSCFSLREKLARSHNKKIIPRRELSFRPFNFFMQIRKFVPAGSHLFQQYQPKPQHSRHN